MYSNPLYSRPYNIKKANWDTFTKELQQNTYLLKTSLFLVENTTPRPIFLDNLEQLE